MKINHVSVFTNDLERLKKYYITYFGAAANNRYHNPKTELQTYFLTFADGARLEIMTKPELADNCSPQPHIGWAHLAFSAGSKEQVDILTKRIVDDGFALFSAPRVTGDGYYESCVSDPDGNQIEIVE